VWEAIASNRRKSLVLISAMGALLVLMGFCVGQALFPYASGPGLRRIGYGMDNRNPLEQRYNHRYRQGYPSDAQSGEAESPFGNRSKTGVSQFFIMNGGGAAGALIALVLWLILSLVAMTQGDNIILSTAGARQITDKAQAPQLWNIVEEMTIASGLGRMPDLYVIDNDAPNAFAVGPKPAKAAIAVTSGLLARLNRDELQGVIGHEMGHIKNYDIRFMTLAAVMVGAMAMISDFFFRSMMYGGGGRRRSSSNENGGGQAQIIFLIVAVVVAILAPIAARILYFASSRRREYLADASSALFTRYPAGLASALEKIASSHQMGSMTEKANRAIAPLYIINPLAALNADGIFSTHPATEKRIAVLRGMGGGAGFADYESAFEHVLGKNEHCIGAPSLQSDTSVPARAASAEPESPQAAVERTREAVDHIDRLANFLFIPCACGVKIKVPPTSTLTSIVCPRCGREHPITTATPALEAMRNAAPKADSQSSETPLRYQRKGNGWESFKCSCGQTIQLSPGFEAPHIDCPKCGRAIEIA
jgi:heat shock protein HtpX